MNDSEQALSNGVASHSTRQKEILMFAILVPPKGKAVAVKQEIHSMNLDYMPICGAKSAQSMCIFFIRRASVDALLYLLDAFSIRFAVTNKGVLRNDGDHLLIDFQGLLSKNDKPESVDYFHSYCLNVLRNEKQFAQMLGL